MGEKAEGLIDFLLFIQTGLIFNNLFLEGNIILTLIEKHIGITHNSTMEGKHNFNPIKKTNKLEEEPWNLKAYSE